MDQSRDTAAAVVVHPIPLWWTMLRDTVMLTVGLGGVIWEHLRNGDPRPLLILTDLVLIGLIPLQHLAPRVSITTTRRRAETA